MALFNVVEGAFVILVRKGVYRQAKVFLRDGEVYAGWGGGFVRLTAGGGTTVPTVSWREFDLPAGYRLGVGNRKAPLIEAQAMKQIDA